MRIRKNARAVVWLSISLLGLVLLSTFVMSRARTDVRQSTSTQTASPGEAQVRDDQSKGHAALSDSRPAVVVLPPTVVSPQIPEGAIASLKSGKVSLQEIESIYTFLESTGEPDGMTPMLLREFKNDLLNRLRAMARPPEDLAQEMIGLYRNSAQDLSIRVYALQHLGLWYNQITGTPLPGEKSYYRPRSATEAAQVRQVLEAALLDRGQGIAGTALLALYYLSENHSEFKTSEVAAVALSLAGDEGYETFSRTAAIQVCGQMGLQAALPLATKLATSATNVPLQMAAVATLGDLGGENERLLLGDILERGNPRLRVACESALERIQKRAPLRGGAG